MKRTKTQKGITLIALIITIVVLMILAVVTINSLQEGGIITHAQNATSSYKQAQIEEEANLLAMEYYMNNKRNMKEETIEEMVNLCKATGVTPKQLTVYYDLYNANANKSNNSNLQEEYVLYRVDKTTDAERQALEAQGAIPFKGDINLDGVLTQDDVEMIEEIGLTGEIDGELVYADDDWTVIKDKFKVQWEIGDIDEDGDVGNGDSYCVELLVRGLAPYEDYINI